MKVDLSPEYEKIFNSHTWEECRMCLTLKGFVLKEDVLGKTYLDIRALRCSVCQKVFFEIPENQKTYQDMVINDMFFDILKESHKILRCEEYVIKEIIE